METMKTENIKEVVTDRDVLSTVKVSSDAGIENIEHMTFKSDISSNEVGRKTIKYETNITEEKITPYDTLMGVKAEINDIKYELDIEEHTLSYKHLKSSSIEGFKTDCGNEYTEYTASCYVLLDRLEFDDRQFINDMETMKCEENVENTSNGNEMNIEKQSAIQKCKCELGKYKLKSGNNHARHCQLENNIERCQSLLPDRKTKGKLTLQTPYKMIQKGNVKYFKCQFCKYTTNHANILKIHVGNKHGDNDELHQPYKYKYKSIARKDHGEHNKVQCNKITKWYQCHYCDFKTKFKGNFLRHHSLKHEGPAEFFYCGLCDFKTKCKYNLLPHLKSKHGDSSEIFHCELCDFKTKCRRYLLKHHRRKHDDSAEIFHCELCDFKTKLKSYLLRHRRLKHDDSAEIFHCELCDHKTKYKYRLLLHHRSKHKGLLQHRPHHDDSAKTFQCEACSFKTKYRHSFVRHQRLQHNSSLAVCHLCSYKTKFHKRLAEHLAKTHGENVQCFQCSICAYSFRKRHYLVKHLRIKHSENPVWNECYSCGFRTKYKRSLVRHMKESHKN